MGALQSFKLLALDQIIWTLKLPRSRSLRSGWHCSMFLKQRFPTSWSVVRTGPLNNGNRAARRYVMLNEAQAENPHPVNLLRPSPNSAGRACQRCSVAPSARVGRQSPGNSRKRRIVRGNPGVAWSGAPVPVGPRLCYQNWFSCRPARH